MSLFSHHVIANSTFSWWGAYLSSQESVLSPSDWFKIQTFQIEIQQIYILQIGYKLKIN